MVNSKKKISIDIDTEKLEKLDNLAKLSARSRSYILSELIADHLDELEGFYIASQRLKYSTEANYLPINKAREKINQIRSTRSKEE